MNAKPLIVVAWLAVGLVPGVVSMQERRAVTADVPVDGVYSPAIAAGGLIYVSGIVGTVPHDVLAPPSDVATETKRIFDRMKLVLAAAGSSVDDLVTVNVFLKRSFDFDPMNAAYRACVSADKPPTRTTVQADLPGDALVMMSGVAVPAGATRETMLPSTWTKSSRPYSYIVRTDDLVFLSGLVSRSGIDDSIVTGSMSVQMRTIFSNAQTLLRTAGVTVDEVVSARVFLTDDSLFDTMNAEYQKVFSHDPPARATGVVGLMGPDAQVEVTLVASRTPKQIVGPQFSPTLPVSTAVRAGHRLFLSGVIGSTDENADDQAAQAREALTRIGRTLELDGASYADVVDSTVYLRDIFARAKVDDVFKEFFPIAPPARTTVGAKLVSRPGLAEIILTAVK